MLGKLVVGTLAIIGGITVYGAADKLDKEYGLKNIKDYLISDAVCNGIEVATAEHLFSDKDGNPDFGYQLTVKVTNKRPAGTLKLDAKLTTGEGEWEKTFFIQAPANSTKDWLVNFPEPTIASMGTKVMGYATCYPAAKTEKSS